MRRYIIFISALFALILFAGPSFAEIRVLSVKGTAAYKAGNQWTPLQSGTTLAVGTKVSTGVRSMVEIKINNHLVTVQPLTIMKINESNDTANSSNTSLGLRRGSVRTKVNKDAPHQDRVQGVDARRKHPRCAVPSRSSCTARRSACAYSC